MRGKYFLTIFIFSMISCPLLRLRNGVGGDELCSLQLDGLQIPENFEEFKNLILEREPQFKPGMAECFISEKLQPEIDPAGSELVREYSRLQKDDDCGDVHRIIRKTDEKTLVYKTENNDQAFCALLADITANDGKEVFELNILYEEKTRHNVCVACINKDGIIKAVFYKVENDGRVSDASWDEIVAGSAGHFMYTEMLGIRLDKNNTWAASIKPNIRDLLTNDKTKYTHPHTIRDNIDRLKDQNAIRLRRLAREDSKDSFEKNRYFYTDSIGHQLYVHCIKSLAGKDIGVFDTTQFAGFPSLLKAIILCQKFLQKEDLLAHNVELTVTEEPGEFRVICERGESGFMLALHLSELAPKHKQTSHRSFVEAIEYFLQLDQNKPWKTDIDQISSKIMKDYPELG